MLVFLDITISYIATALQVGELVVGWAKVKLRAANNSLEVDDSPGTGKGLQ